MFDTYITIVGNVLNQPETRQTLRTGALVTSFRVASTSRRFDKAKEVWVDGESLRLKVSCWRRLGDHVAASVRQGDPVIVTGRIYTREYQLANGEKRLAFELDAAAVGHDLARGTGRFNRWRPTPGDMLSDAADYLGVDQLAASTAVDDTDEGADEEVDASEESELQDRELVAT